MVIDNYPMGTELPKTYNPPPPFKLPEEMKKQVPRGVEFNEEYVSTTMARYNMLKRLDVVDKESTKQVKSEEGESEDSDDDDYDPSDEHEGDHIPPPPTQRINQPQEINQQYMFDQMNTNQNGILHVNIPHMNQQTMQQLNSGNNQDIDYMQIFQQ
jgi:hypothetical protein